MKKEAEGPRWALHSPHTYSSLGQKNGPFKAVLDLHNDCLMLKIKDDTVDLKKGCGEMTMKKEVLPGGGDQLLSVGWAVHTQ